MDRHDVCLSLEFRTNWGRFAPVQVVLSPCLLHLERTSSAGLSTQAFDCLQVALHLRQHWREISFLRHEDQ